MTAYRDGKQWRWRRQVRQKGQMPKRGSGTPAINTKAAALEDEHAWVQRVREGREDEVEYPTLGALAKDYLSHVRMHKSPALADNRASQFKTHIVPTFGRTRTDRIDVAMVDRFKADLLADKKAPGTINQNILGLSNFLRWAHKRRKAPPVPKLELLPRKTSAELDEVEHLEAAELEHVVNAASGELRTMIQFAAHTGLRIGELLALRWSDVEEARVTIRRSRYRNKDGPTKNKKPRRVPLSLLARSVLLAHKHARGEYVFCDPDGAPLVYSTALEHAQAAGLGGWHVLRHTFGTMLSSRGVPLKAIQEWMGHADIKTTMIYARYSPVLDSAIHVLDTGETWQPGDNGLAHRGKTGDDTNG